MPTWSSARPLDTDSVANISRIIRTSDGYPLTEEVFSNMRNTELSTNPFIMDAWADACPPGPIT